MRRLFPMLSALSAILISVPAFPQVYKWVDGKGVTNYSNSPPADAVARTKLHTVAEKISVYTPDKALLRAIHNGARNTEAILSKKIDRLEQSLEAERRARRYAAAVQSGAAQAATEGCLAERRVDCDSYGGYPPYRPVVMASSGNRRMPFVPIVPLNGVTAGNVVAAIANAGASVDYIPGVAAGNGLAFRTARSGSRSRGFPSR